jgi:hypothetical protein
MPYEIHYHRKAVYDNHIVDRFQMLIQNALRKQLEINSSRMKIL